MSCKILIASSDASLLENAERLLTAHNHQTFTFVDGIDALMGVVNCRPNLILVDRSLSQLNAHQFCYFVKRKYRIQINSRDYPLTDQRAG